jgi:hypothetical protein
VIADGGAAVAALVAARRSDVAGLRAIAGNLDRGALNEHHRVEVLRGSRNPIDYASKIRQIPMRHFIRTHCSGLHRAIVRPENGRPVLPERCGSRGGTHSKGWREGWRSLLRTPTSVPPQRIPD